MRLSDASMRVYAGPGAPLVLARLWPELENARRVFARRRLPELLPVARDLLAVLSSVQVRSELAQAAAAFADGRDEKPDAEEWVAFAVAARAALDQAEKSGAAVLARELEELDASLDDAREAVLLLEPEDYKEALAATPPHTGRWWGERARLDAGLREIDLERALDALGPPSIDVDLTF